MRKGFLVLGFSLIVLSFMFAFQSHAADWQRTVVFMYGQTQSGQDMFVRGGIDHTYAQNNLGRTCTAENKLCAIPIQHLNNLNATTNPWKTNDGYLDWYGTEPNQSTQAQGTPMDWTTNIWPASWGTKRTVDVDGYGETALNTWGQHYWIMDVMMDCSATVNGWFELKSFISNGPGWEANVSQAGTPYSSGNHFAKCGKINKFERGSNAVVFQDVPVTTPTANKFYIQVSAAKDFVFLQVNGVERMRWGMPPAERFNQPNIARLGKKIDISHLLAQGDNHIKLVAASNHENTIASYDIKLWADNQLILNRQEQRVTTTPGFKPILLDQQLTVNRLTGPAIRTLTVTKSSSFDSAIYINNVYTGKHAPASFELAEGEYRLGIGESITTPDWSNNTVLMMGKFREQDIVLGSQNMTIDSNSMPLLQNNNVHKVALIPMTHVHHGLTNAQADQGILAPAHNIGVMTADDIQVAEKSLNETSAKWLNPISYGQTSWQVTVLAPVTERVYLTDHLRWHESQHSADLSSYDLIVIVIANQTAPNANNQRSYIGLGGAASGRLSWMPQTWLDSSSGTTLTQRLANVKPSPGMIHEAFHNYDGYTRNDYTGIASLHGGEEHAYGSNDCGLPSEWVCWYRDYGRAQVAEDITTAHEVNAVIKPVPTVSQFVGIFNVLHSGLGIEQQWSFSKPTSRIHNSAYANCIEVNGASTQDNAGIIGGACNQTNNQRWSLQHIHNGAYHLVNENSQKCGEIVAGQLLQKTCSTALAQRFLIEPASATEFTIKSLGDQCLTLPSFNATAALNICNPGQFSQLWSMD